MGEHLSDEPLIVLDLRSALDTRDEVWAYDAAKATAALQGTVNREQPRLFVLYIDNHLLPERGTSSLDVFWLKWLQDEDRLLADRTIIKTDDLKQVFEHFKDHIRGLALWDEKVPATANVASTLAGAEDVLPIRGDESPDSFLSFLRNSGYAQPVLYDLRNQFTGTGIIPGTDIPTTDSAKCDAYVWAVENIMKTGKCSPEHMAYYVDGIRWNSLAPNTSEYPDLGNAGVLNADYWISRRAFFFDLSPWEDEAPNDDPEQPVGTDHNTLRLIMREANRRVPDRMITIGGFVPWWLKYCRSSWAGRNPETSRYDPVPTEWHFVDVVSAFNGMLDADAYGLTGMANASVYRHYPLQDQYEQPAPDISNVQYDPDTCYVIFGMLDYDSAAWLAQSYQARWSEPERGSIPLWWGFNPILSDRIPMVFDAVMKERTENDTIGADEGLGYTNFNLLGGDRRFSDLPDAYDIWLQHAQPYYNQFDMTSTVFVITGFEPKITEEALKVLEKTSPVLIGFQGGKAPVNGPYGETCLIMQREDWHGLSVERASERLEHILEHDGKGAFIFIRTILKSPGLLKEAVQQTRTRRPDLRFEVVGPHVMAELMRQEKMASQ